MATPSSNPYPPPPAAAAAAAAGALERELLDLETQTWDALKSSGTALLPFLAPDCVMLLPGATLFAADTTPTLAEILSRADMKPWTRYRIRHPRVVSLAREGGGGEILGPAVESAAAAAVCYEVEAEREDSDVYEALITSVWRRDQEGVWRMCVHQQTPKLI